MGMRQKSRAARCMANSSWGARTIVRCANTKPQAASDRLRLCRTGIPLLTGHAGRRCGSRGNEPGERDARLDAGFYIHLIGLRHFLLVADDLGGEDILEVLSGRQVRGDEMALVADLV